MSQEQNNEKILSSVDEAIEDIRAGKVVIVVDDEDRENEGDFIVAGEKITPEIVNFMAAHGRGLICAPLSAERASELNLSTPASLTDPFGTAFTQSVDAKRGTTTGISAFDRATTVKALIDPATSPADFVSPGHLFPLIARPGGVLRRAGHTEAAVDLARLAGLPPGGVLCEILSADGTMVRVPQLLAFCREFKLRIGSVEALAAYLSR